MVRGDTISGYLSSERPENIEAEANRLAALAAATGDAKARESFLVATESKKKQLETYRQLVGLYDQVHAQLKVIDTSLDGLSAKIVKLRATDVQEAVSINESISTHVETVSADIAALEDNVEATMQEYRA